LLRQRSVEARHEKAKRGDLIITAPLGYMPVVGVIEVIEKTNPILRGLGEILCDGTLREVPRIVSAIKTLQSPRSDRPHNLMQERVVWEVRTLRAMWREAGTCSRSGY
jgi:hypothetical protein